MPEGLAARVFHAPGIDIEARTQPERGLETATQIFPACNGQIAALNGARLSRAIKAAIDAAINQAADADVGSLRGSGQGCRQKSETCGISNANTQAHAGGSP